MERVEATGLQYFVNRYLLFQDPHSLEVMYLLGKSLKEFHDLPIKGFPEGDFPASQDSLKEELTQMEVDLPLNSKLDSRIFRKVNLHGESYFTHFLFSEKTRKFIFFDLHNSSRGPALFDMATFTVSLYTSLLLLPFPLKNITPLRNAFLAGYFPKDPPIASLKVAEMFVLLRELNKLFRLLEHAESLKVSVRTSLKLKKVKRAIQHCLHSSTTRQISWLV